MFQPRLWVKWAFFLDDEYSNSWEVHMDLLTLLAEPRLIVNLAKCVFARATVTCFSRVVAQGQMWPVGAKIQTV